MSPEEDHTSFGGTVEPWELVGKRPAGQPQSDTGVCNTATHTHTLQILIAHKHHTCVTMAVAATLRAARIWFDCLLAVVLRSYC